MNESRVDRAIKILLVTVAAGLCLICLATLWGPAIGTRLGPIQYFLFERKWVSRGDLDWAGFPTTAYEIVPGNTEWGDVTARYYFSSGSSTGESLYAQFSSPEQGSLASLGMVTGYGSIIYIQPFMDNAPYDVRADEACGPVDIAWANDKKQCTCSIQGVPGACLSWWTDEGLFVIISQTLDADALEDFANSLTPVSR